MQEFESEVDLLSSPLALPQHSLPSILGIRDWCCHLRENVEFLREFSIFEAGKAITSAHDVLSVLKFKI